MKTRRDFLKTSGGLALGTLFIPSLSKAEKLKNVGIQLYSVRKEMLADAIGTLKELAKIGYKELESARSEKGNYYGLQPERNQENSFRPGDDASQRSCPYRQRFSTVH